MKQTMDLRGSLQMTPRLIDAIHLLQLSAIDLTKHVQEEVDRNPFLTFKEKPFTQKKIDFDQIANIKAPVSFIDQLYSQISYIFKSTQEKKIAKILTYYLNNEGYFDGDVLFIAKQLKMQENKVEHVLHKLQTCEPVGIFSRSLKDSLYIQLQHRMTPTIELFLASINELESLGLQKYCKKLKISYEEGENIIKILRTLKQTPLGGSSEIIRRIPDVIVTYTNNKNDPFLVEMNPDILPEVFLETNYYNTLKQACKNPNDLNYINTQKKHADWLIQALSQRTLNTILVTREILFQQKDFFENGINALKPLCLQDIAKKIGIHESTVSRITTDRTMDTPIGLFNFKFFFSSKLKAVTRSDVSYSSSKTVMDKIKSLIKQENTPLSDEDIVILLHQEGIQIARRTVAKYRDLMGISSSSKRRKLC